MKSINITTKLTIAFIFFGGLLLIGLSIPAYIKSRESLRNATVSELISTSLEKQSALDAWITRGQQSIRDIARQQYLSGLVSSLLNSSPNSTEWTINTNAILSVLNDWSGEGQNFINLQVIDSQNGQIIVSTDNADIGKFREDQPFFIEGMKSAYIQNPYYDLTSQRPIMTASAPIISSEGKVIGVLAGRLNLIELNDIILRRTGLHQSDDVFLVNSSHFFITQPRLIPDPAVLKRGVYTNAVNACLNQTNGEIDTLDYRGTPAIIVFRWLPQQQLCLITKIDQQEAYEPIQSLGATMILTGLLVLLLGAIGAIILSRSISKPVLQLADGTAQLSQGNLDYRINIFSSDEIGQLGTAFNQMAEVIAGKDAQLHGWAEELEHRVAERTDELLASESKFRTLALRQEAILSAVPDILMEVDNNKHYTWANPAGLEFFGEDVIGKEASFYFEGQQTTYDIVNPLFAGNENVVYLESWQRRKDGEVRLLAWYCKTLKDGNGNVTGALSSAIDSTERWKMEKALQESEKGLVEAQNLANIGSWEYDIAADKATWTWKMFDLFGRDPNLGEPAWQEHRTSIHPDDWEALDKAVTSGEPYDIEFRLLHPTRGIRWAHTIGQVEKDGNGRVVKLKGTVQDITERKNAEEEIQQLNKNLETKVEERTAQLANANKELESFSYSVSHDLRAPLRALDGFSLAVLEDYGSKLDDIGKDYLNRIREASQKMAKLIDSMLVLSRATKADLTLTDINLTEIAGTIASDFGKNNPDRKVTWKIEPGMTAHADAVLMKSALENLLGNAWKFTSKHSTATIEVGVFHENGETVYFVKDDGAGFDNGYSSKLFGAFQRMHSTAEFEGTGIGLATVQRIISKHGGRIWADGKPEGGATFYFTLYNGREK